MSETVARHRPSVDLDDFERRMAQPGAHHDHHPHDLDDPLAELARLVGEQPDPYGDVFSREAVVRPRETLADDRRHGERAEPTFGRGVDFAAIEAGLRGAIPAHPEQDPRGYDPATYAESGAGFAETYPEPREEWAEAAPRGQSRSRAPIYAMVATIAVGVIGIGVAFAFKGTSSSPREIKTIMAAAGPTKIQPPADTAATPGDDATQQPGLANQAAPTKLASREEQPVDLSQAVQDNNARDNAAAARQGADAASVPVPLSPGHAHDGIATPDYAAMANGAALSASASAPAAVAPDSNDSFGAGMPAPKKVKVVSVRPDGSIVTGDTAPVTAAPLDSPKSTEKPTRATKSTKSTSRVTPKPMDLAAAAGDDASPAVKPTKTAKKAKPTRVATADTGDQATDATPASKETSGGGFAVQFAAPGSESDAKAVSAKFGKKFADALSGRRLGFHKAESNGRTVYRVRTAGLSREEATSLCEKVKADGGSCFVARN